MSKEEIIRCDICKKKMDMEKNYLDIADAAGHEIFSIEDICDICTTDIINYLNDMVKN